jgi:hypothetical protein
MWGDQGSKVQCLSACITLMRASSKNDYMSWQYRNANAVLQANGLCRSYDHVGLKCVHTKWTSQVRRCTFFSSYASPRRCSNMKFATILSSFLLTAPSLAQMPAGFAPGTNTTLDVYYGSQYISPGLIIRKSRTYSPTSLATRSKTRQ